MLFHSRFRGEKKPVGRSGPTTKGGEGPHFKHFLRLGIETHDALPGHTQKDLDHLVLLGDFFLWFISQKPDRLVGEQQNRKNKKQKKKSEGVP